MSTFEDKELRMPIAEGCDLQEEGAFNQLNTCGFVRAGTAKAQWLLLINESWKATQLPLQELVRDYLVLMLDRFTTRTDLLSVMVGLEYYVRTLVNESNRINKACVQDLADIGIHHVALFPGRLAYRHYPQSVKQTYTLSQTLYAQLSRQNTNQDDWWGKAYAAMSENFFTAVIVLKRISKFLAIEEEELRRMYGEAVRFPSLVEQSIVEHFKHMYLHDDADSSSM
jgi:hypothetical protein